MLLTDAELDHVTGLLSLRETQTIPLRCTRRVYEWVFAANPIFEALTAAGKFSWAEIQNHQPETNRETNLTYEAVFVDGKIPTYVKTPSDGLEEATVAYRIIDDQSRSSILYVPAIKRIGEALIAATAGCDCVLFDGSFWSDDEMARQGVGSRTSLAMGHVPIDGPDGSLARLAHLRARKVYTHVNNTNPILDEASPERRAIETAGWEVAEDGMDFIV